MAFLYTHVAGVRLPDDPGPDAAGNRHFVVQPCPGGGLSEVIAEHTTPYGVIRSAWHRTGTQLHLTVDVPAGCRAEVRLPEGGVEAAGPGHHEYTSVVADDNAQSHRSAS